MKASYVFGTITILGIVGVTIYAIKKSKDEQKVSEQAISLDEARAIVKEREKQNNPVGTGFKDGFVGYAKADVEATQMMFKELSNFPDDIELAPRFENGKMTSVSIVGVRKRDEINEDNKEEDDELDDENYQEDGIAVDPPNNFLKDVPPSENITEEDKTLRFEPSSPEALNQYKRMELADWHPTDENYQIMMKLFEFPFQPKCDGDDMLRNNLIDYRVQFFGFNSKWVQQVTYADVILYYAKSAQYNCDETVRYWVEYFLDFNEFNLYKANYEIDELLLALNAHTYFNEERQTFGLFGLTREYMDSAFKIANRNVDCSVTYEIEFNEFLKSCL